MNEAEKERLIKKDIESIENKVRHAFNQGYEMGMKDREKLNCTDCIIEKSGDFIKSRSEILNKSEIPTSCGDAISRQAVLDLIEHYNSDGLGSVFYGYEQGVKFAGAVNKLPSVTPRQRTGRWIPVGYDGYADGNPVYDWWECSECGWEHTGDEESLTAFCPNCGAKMEVEE